MSSPICLTLFEALRSLSDREAILAALPGLLEPWGMMLYDATASCGLELYEGSDIVGRLVGDDDSQLPAVAGMLSHMLSTAAERRAAELGRTLAHILTTNEQPLETALEAVLAVFHGHTGVLLEQRGSQFETLAQAGQPVSENLWLDPKQLWTVAKAKEAHYNTLTVCPVSHTVPARTLLLMHRSLPWTQADRNLLESACHLLYGWQRCQRHQHQLKMLLDLERVGLDAVPEALFQCVLEAAVKTVPGAEAGSLLVKQGSSFRFCAALGFDLASLREVSLKASDMQAWHQTPQSTTWSWEARIAEITENFLDYVYANTEVPEALQRAGRLEEIKANLFVPIIYQGELLAVLNLDNFHDREAFAEDSLQAAQLFGSPVAVILRERHYRSLLEQAALTDALTGIGNRRAFEAALKQEVVKSTRYQQAFCLLLLDLSNFKRINDDLGHGYGDSALIHVAETLQYLKRRADTVFRLGGDEFAVLLPQTHYEGGLIAARRYARAIKRIEVLGYHLGVNIGVASFPNCASSQDVLFELADRRMYSAKLAGYSVYCEPSNELGLESLALEETESHDATFVLV
jgi:diguanylate cyclase (GGDEF)-like protein